MLTVKYMQNLIKRRCDLKDIGGKPGEGVHSIRLFNIAVVDLMLTIIAGLVLALLFRTSLMGSLLIILVLIGLGVIVHWYFCVDTTLNKLIFGKSA